MTMRVTMALFAGFSMLSAHASLGVASRESTISPSDREGMAVVCTEDVLQRSADHSRDCLPDDAAFCMDARCVNTFAAIAQDDRFACALPRLNGLPTVPPHSTLQANALKTLQQCTSSQIQSAVDSYRKSAAFDLSQLSANGSRPAHGLAPSLPIVVLSLLTAINRL